MSSVYERIHVRLAETLLAGLEALYGLGNVKIERNRDHAFQDVDIPTGGVVNILDGDINPEEENTGVAAYTTTPVIEGYVVRAESSELGEARSLLLGRVVKVWKSDRKLGGVAIDTTEIPGEQTLMPAPARAPNQSPIAMFSHPIKILFWTEEDDPFLIGPY